MCTKDSGKQRPEVVKQLLSSFRSASEQDLGAGSSASGDEPRGPALALLSGARVLLLLLTRDSACREEGHKQGVVGLVLDALQAWQKQYTAAAQALPADAPTEQAQRQLAVPVWVEASTLLLELLAGATVKQRRAGSGAAAAAPAAGAAAGAAASAAPAAAAAEATSGGAAADAAGAPAAAQPAALAPADQPAPSAGAGPLPSTATVVAAAPTSAPDVALPPELAGLPGVQEALRAWRPCGLLDESEQQVGAGPLLLLLGAAAAWARR